MPITRSALKQVRVNLRKHTRSGPIRSAVRTYIAKAAGLIQARQLEPAQSGVSQAIRALDKAAEKKVLHPNNAARRKSRLMKKLNAVRKLALVAEPVAPAARTRTPRRRTSGRSSAASSGG